jgi:hypothetical protein
MAYADYRNDLLAAAFDANRMLDRYFHSGQSVAFLGAHPEAEPAFKTDLARRLYGSLQVQLHPLQLILCGSAHLGFSPVPDKLGKAFDSRSSDIDVAVVSADLFDDWWSELQASDILPSVLKRVSEDLFWGFINPANVNNVSDIGRKWWRLFGEIKTERASGVRGRVYRNFWSMQSYHMHAINEARKTLLNQRV